MTDFEKLLYAEGYIRELKKEISKSEFNNGILISEVNELLYYLKETKPESNKLRIYKKQNRDKDKKIQKLKEEIDKHKLENLKLNKELSYYKLLNKQLCQQ